MPHLRIPLWAAAAIPVAAYVVRSVVRGTAIPDLPADAIVLCALLVALGLAARYGSAQQHRQDELDAQMDERNPGESGSGQHDKI